ncbi:hypothetical protein, partial [Ralstonia pseudosolanacearum]|uniref:hypothetical protein n=1 Tax=Ralstonia pseudosolanacearum TaxID=1310165 RepID=UPI003CE766E3
KLEEESRILVNEILSEEERKKKLVYMFTSEQYTGAFKLVAFDPHGSEPPRSRFIDKTSMIKQDMPPDLLQLRDYEFAALGSKLYFIGGVHIGGVRYYDEALASDKVFAFDMAAQAWDFDVPCMKLKRADSTVATYENKIYVFAYNSNRLEGETPLAEHWAEFFDPQANAWNYLPGP